MEAHKDSLVEKHCSYKRWYIYIPEGVSDNVSLNGIGHVPIYEPVIVSRVPEIFCGLRLELGVELTASELCGLGLER